MPAKIPLPNHRKPASPRTNAQKRLASITITLCRGNVFKFAENGEDEIVRARSSELIALFGEVVESMGVNGNSGYEHDVEENWVEPEAARRFSKGAIGVILRPDGFGPNARSVS